MDSSHTYFAVISWDSAIKQDESDYPQVFFKKCKYIEKNINRHINDNLIDFSLSDEPDQEQLPG